MRERAVRAQAGMDGAAAPPLSWFGIVRLGLVQTALGAIFVLSTATLNRVMVVELALPAVLPGALIALHYATQLLRPRLGHGSDVGGRRTPWIVGGMAVLAMGGVLAALATALMTRHLVAGILLAVPAFVLIGVGVGAAGTALLVLLAGRTAPARRPAAATLVWVMMIVGFVLTAAVAGRALDPFSPGRLVAVAAAISAVGFLVACLAVRGVEGPAPMLPEEPAAPGGFARALREVWAEPQARTFAALIFVSMLAYGGEELLIEPYAGTLFGLTPGQTAKLSGQLHVGSLIGMVLLAIVGTALARRPGSSQGGSLEDRSSAGSLKGWMAGGCVASAMALVALASLGLANRPAPLGLVLLALGAANGTYAVAAIGAMMQQVGGASGRGGEATAGVRMGLWGAAQAVAFGAGGLLATVLSDAARHFMPTPAGAYALVFALQACAFLAAAVMATRLGRRRPMAAGRGAGPQRIVMETP